MRMIDLISSRTGRISARYAPANGQRGVVLVVALVALVVLLFSSVALVKSFQAASALSGGLAFKRDLVSRAERGFQQAMGVINTTINAAPENNLPASFYFATSLANDSHGIPSLLLTDAAFTAAGLSTSADINAGDSVTVRYVIDRQCATGTTVFNSQLCGATSIPQKKIQAGSDSDPSKGSLGGDLHPIYRISVRVSGPRGSQAYLQYNVIR